MKRIGLFPIICGILLLSIPIFMNAQPYPDYAMGFVTPQAMHSVIRYYSPTQAVVANHNESTRSLPFGSMDRTASYNAIVATGGDYWFVKTIPIITNGHNCYNPVSVDVYKLYDITGNYGCYSYIHGPAKFSSSYSNPTPTSSIIRGSCF